MKLRGSGALSAPAMGIVPNRGVDGDRLPAIRQFRANGATVRPDDPGDLNARRESRRRRGRIADDRPGRANDQ